MARFLNFESANGEITCNGAPIRIKGVNWFGMESGIFLPHGLWQASFDAIFKTIADNNFNAVRVPLSIGGVENMEIQTVAPGGKGLDSKANSTWVGRTMAACLDRFITRCGEQGILVMLDMHVLEVDGVITELWYDAKHDEHRLINAWKTVLARFQHHWNFFACDLKNEPHGRATWGDGSPTDWRTAAERIGNAILSVCPRMLIFVEGIEGSAQQCWWGGFLGLAAKDPVRLSNPKRLVYSPHVYGPDVASQPYFKAANFPQNMLDVWKRHWGHLRLERSGPAVCIGEWGGKALPGSLDLTLQRALAEYLCYYGFNAFYWCLNPNSKDTGGILADDWATLNATKLQLIHASCPAPTSFAGGKPITPPQPAFSVPWAPLLKLSPAAPTRKPKPDPSPIPDPNPKPRPGPSPIPHPDPKPNPGPKPDPKPNPGPKPDPKPNPGPKPDPKPNPGPKPDPKPTPGPKPNPTPLPRLATKRNHSWKGEGGEVTQWDASLTNTSAVALKSVRFIVNGATVVNVWNMQMVNPGVYKLPSWLTNVGGLQPNATHSFGLITHNGNPQFSVDTNAK